MIKILINNIVWKMLLKIFKDFLINMVLNSKIKKNSSKNTTLNVKKTPMISYNSQEVPISNK
jgi:hypothetical protein